MKKAYFQVTIIAFFAVTAVGCVPSHQLNRSEHNAIYGGRDVLENEALGRSVVAIHSVYPGANEGTICSGTILNDSLIITAAHCLVEKGVVRTILFGVDATHAKHKRKVVKEITHPEWAKIERIHVMPDEERSAEDDVIYLQSSWYDIALLKFEGGLPEGFAPTMVLSDFNKIQKGTKVLAAGFGVSDAENRKGIGRLRSAELLIDNPEFHDNELSVDQKESGTCEGDSGGPIFLKEGESFFLVGLTSHGINDSFCRGTAVFTSVIPFGDWLNQNAK